ncbi:multicopper oxidase family protein [Streptomyces coelicoflavus]|jgi:FtsP/CotA-like multicopper oxidase with cupredoxin domain|uniref:Putative multicopper oxidase n=1 Tax=Streptomyces albus (strain ATCC 21838 / DSM 41398 / FERM P-419 / JCM 4703 / NBRC 107858) TaxID=1081613 RepID=A0A0B5EQV0_STRA4|nr:putative multicopper oxidase [Streptomyces albus]AOU75966.1 putative multicopper oxidase [Streptomyces albus]AYN31769.1 copper oxidase [Streptomyces albus]MCP8706818.1 multicopper oxidase family protein [Streptomyces sp. AC04842]WDI21679.1 multicopper oxidase family protein [Streptomyces enissocaesilis]
MKSINRRSVLLAGLGAAGTGALAACGGSGGSGSGDKVLVSPSGAAVAAAEKKRTSTGRTHKLTLTAAPARIDLGGGVMPRTWAFDGRTPGKEVRLSVGDTLAAELSNQLPGRTATSIHWHGLALRNDMDGVPPLTQAAVRAGSTFTYRFTADAPGTYFFHPHVGVQLDRGLYAPLIVEDLREPLAYDDEWVVLLDDWVDGVTGTPDEVFAELRHGMGGMSGHMDTAGTPSASSGMDGHDMGDMGGMDMGEASSPPASAVAPSGGMAMKFMLMGATSKLLGGDAGDVKYPHHLVNGKVATDPDVYRGKPGRKVRLRIINAGSDTAYRVALGDHKLTVTHTDGYPVQHQEVDALLVGMGERYDVLVTLGDGVFPLVALAEGKNASGLALVRTGSGSAPSASVRPRELDGMIMTASQLRAADDVRLASAKTDVTHQVKLTGGMEKYNWAINGRPFDMADPQANPILVQEGQRVRLDFVNGTDMWHPMHLHGHTYQLGSSGPRKDTTIVLPRTKTSVFLDADNPGQWMLHCHNAYHGEAGMMANVAYRA